MYDERTVRHDFYLIRHGPSETFEFDSNHIHVVMYAKINIKLLKSREHGPEKNYKGPGKVLEFCQADSVGTMYEFSQY